MCDVVREKFSQFTDCPQTILPRDLNGTIKEWIDNQTDFTFEIVIQILSLK